MIEIVLMAHVFFGVACPFAALWVCVDTLNFSEANQRRIQKMSYAAAVFMWLSFLLAGYWYVFYYKADKAIILNGPFPLAHNFFMEAKEHLAIILLMLASYLPIAAADNLLAHTGARRVLIWVAGMTVVLALMMESGGGVIAMGVKAGLLSR
ncbi:MAG: hypothetical protein WCQ16_03565 [Verrucomicrobiae bacterium]